MTKLNLPEKEICDKYLSGMSTVDLAKEYNCNNETIGNRLRKNNIKLRNCSERNHQRLISDPTISIRTGKSLKQAHIDDPTISERISEGLFQAHVDDPTISERMSESTIQSYIDDPTYIERISTGLLQAHIDDPTISERNSAIMQGQDYDAGEWTGFVDSDNRDYIDDERDCIKLNKRFDGCHMHHITPCIIIYIPSELHVHYPHNMKTGLNMYEINMTAFQYLNSGGI